MGGLFEYFKFGSRGRKAKEKKTKGKTPTIGEDQANGIDAQPEPAGPGNGVGPLVIVNNIVEGSAGAGTSGTDIVFVHGLRGARLGTWSKDSVCWPRDFLRNDLKDVRVIAWGYDASVAKAFHAASKESIFGHADTLLDDLAQLRVGTTRPIIFVCHSLGGLVVKEALIKADNYNNHKRHPTLGAIFAHTTGVIFMGTPHRGSSKETYGDVLVKIAKVALHQPNDQLLQTLRPGSHILENQREQFTTISPHMSIVCIREELNTAIGVIVPEASATYDGFNVRRGAINANHMDMVRFASHQDPGYKRTLGFIVELCNAGQAAQRVATKRPEERSDEILEILKFRSMDDRELAIEKAYADTCAWVMDDRSSAGTSNPSAPRFKSWLENSESIFWISGKAGCGKSTLMKFIYEHKDTTAALTEWAGKTKLIKAGHFFLERGDDLQKSREGMVRSILCQILAERRELIPVAFPTFFGDVPPTSKAVNTWKNLSLAFDAVLDGLTDSKVCLFIDGLDEYRMIDKKHEYTQEQLDNLFDGSKEDESWGLSDWIVDGHKEIAELVLRFNDRSNAKICLSSRELNVFEQRFSSLPRLEVHHYTAGPIEQYCEGRLAKEAPSLGDYSSFVSSITKKSRGVFLWVRLVVDMLVDGTANGDPTPELWKTLETLPVRLGGKNGLYMRMMQNVKKSYLPEAERLFQLVMHWDAAMIGVRDNMDIITLFAAQEGHLETDGDGGLRAKKDKFAPETWNGLRPRWTELERRLKSRCGGLLEGSDGVQFMHQTAKEFMSRKYLWDLIFPKSNGFVPGTAEDLAILSGLIRRLKCCQELTLEARKIQGAVSHQSPPQGSGPGSASSQLAYELLNCALMAAVKTGESHRESKNMDVYEQLVGELDATGNYLTSPQGTDITTRDRRTWVEVFLDVDRLTINTVHSTGWRPTTLLELMIGFNIHRYVVPKLKGKGILQPSPQALLQAASTGFSLVFRGEAFEYRGWPSPEVVEVLFAEGADPNAKLDESDDPNPEPNKMDRPDGAVGPPKGLTVWTSLLYNAYTGAFDLFGAEDVLPVMQKFLQNGADPMARFLRGDTELITVEKAIKTFVARSSLDGELNHFPDIVALLQHKERETGRVLRPILPGD